MKGGGCVYRGLPVNKCIDAIYTTKDDLDYCKRIDNKCELKKKVKFSSIKDIKEVQSLQTTKNVNKRVTKTIKPVQPKERQQKVKKSEQRAFIKANAYQKYLSDQLTDLDKINLTINDIGYIYNKLNKKNKDNEFDYQLFILKLIGKELAKWKQFIETKKFDKFSQINFNKIKEYFTIGNDEWDLLSSIPNV
jgi:hypothetical protein